MTDGHELILDAVSGDTRAVRAFTARALAGAPDDAVHDAQLVATELVTNAVLHGLPPVRVVVRRRDGRARVEVSDAGRRMPLRMRPGSGALTGRGLGLVAVLAAAWGSEPLPAGGKVVWAEVEEDRRALADVPPTDTAPPADHWPQAGEEPLLTVELGDVPTDLLLAAKSHVDNLVREFALLESADRPLPPALTTLVQTVEHEFAGARDQIKRQAVAAAEAGEQVTHLRLVLPPSAAEAAERYLGALDEADRYAREARLLTTETPHAHRVFRHWYVEALAAQLRAAGEGAPAPQVPTLVQRLVEEITALAGARAAAVQLQLLQVVTAALAGAGTVEQIADAVVTQATDVLSATAARVYLLHDDGVLRAVATAGGDPDVASRYDELPATDDLPGGRALRTGESVVVRSRAQLARQFPALAGVYAEERTLLVAPLVAADRPIGVLSLSFTPDAEVDDAAQTAFLSTLATVTAQALQRVQQAAAAEAVLPEQPAGGRPPAHDPPAVGTG